MAYPRSKMLDFTAFPPAAVTMFSEKRVKCYYSPEFGQILLLTAYSLFNAKCNDLSQGHFPPPKRYKTGGKTPKKPNSLDPILPPLPVRD